MGISEKEPNLQQIDAATPSRVLSIAALMIILALFAPVASSGYDYGWGFFLMIIAMTWTLYVEGGYMVRFEFLPPYTMITMLPFLLFRVGSVYLIARYYQGKTTKGRAKIAAIFSDGPFLVLYSFAMIIGGIYGAIGLNLPLPIMMFVSFLLLWKSPVPEATVPWEGMADPTPWWEEEKQEEKVEVTNDEQPW